MEKCTGVTDGQYLKNRLQEEFARYLRTKQPLSFLLLKIDQLKPIHDQYGLLAGDYVMEEFGQILPSVLRKYDIMGRYNGEDFGVILPHTTLTSSVPVAERIRLTVENHPFIFEQKKLPLTVSIGVAETNRTTVNIEKILSVADEALRRAIENGKNRVCYLGN